MVNCASARSRGDGTADLVGCSVVVCGARASQPSRPRGCSFDRRPLCTDHQPPTTHHITTNSKMVSVRSANTLAKLATRSFSSTSAPLAPPKPAKSEPPSPSGLGNHKPQANRPPRKIAPNKKPQLWQLKKGAAAEEVRSLACIARCADAQLTSLVAHLFAPVVQDGAAAGGSGGGGSVLSEVVQPKVDLSYLQTLQPVSR